MSVTKKIKTTHNKVKQNKAQYDLDRQINKISALLLGNVDNMNSSQVKMF